MKVTLLTLVLVVGLRSKALIGAAGAPEQVLDTSGKSVRVRTTYYVVPASPDAGGLSLASTGQDCPLDVVAVDDSTVWKLKDYDYSTSQWFVTTGGSSGHPGSQTVGNWFKIERYEDAYKLVYCPSVCNDCSYPCRDIGIYQDQYGKRLFLTSHPYKPPEIVSSDSARWSEGLVEKRKKYGMKDAP
ncbi:hypothetical protein VNO78_32598 [Psophocarpus tetragonolobus]|uniref:Miraculin-like n=1 Tax=Psophocarpus tetragonolobus TaxID=3891 RepID=A0AAN9RS41_PSOTE